MNALIKLAALNPRNAKWGKLVNNLLVDALIEQTTSIPEILTDED